MPSNKRSFTGLLNPPQAIPDDDEDQKPDISIVRDDTPPEVITEPETPADAPERAVAPSPEPELPPAAEPAAAASAPKQSAPRRSPVKASESSPAPTAKVPTTVRLQLPAATALREAWLEARRTDDPMLSFPTFASEVVLAGLNVVEKKKRR